MQIYEYMCRQCGHTIHDSHRGDDYGPCPFCDDSLLKRVWHVNVAKVTTIQEHFNPTTGQYVRNKRDLMTQFDKMSEDYTMRSGIEHKFVPVDPADAKAVYGIKDEHAAEAAEQTHIANVKAGKEEHSAKWL